MAQDHSYPVAWIDLARGDVQVRYVDDDILAKFVGGKGLAAHILYSHLPAKIDPLGPENLPECSWTRSSSTSCQCACSPDQSSI